MGKKGKLLGSLTLDEFREYTSLISLEESIKDMLQILNVNNNLTTKILKKILFYFCCKIDKSKKKFFLKITKKYKIYNFYIDEGDLYINE